MKTVFEFLSWCAIYVALLVVAALSCQGRFIMFTWDASAGADGYRITLTPSQPFFSTNRTEIHFFDVETNATEIDLKGGTWNAMVVAWSTNNPQHIRIESSAAMLGPFSVPDETGGLAVNISAPMIAPELVLSSNKTARATMWISVSTNLTDWSDWTPTLDMWLGDGPRAYYRAALSMTKP